MIVLPELLRRLLWQSQQKVRKVISGSGHGASTGELRSIQTAKYERPARIAVRFRIHLHPPEIRAPSPRMLAVVPDHIVGESVSLVPGKRRSYVLKTAEVCERKIRQPPVKRIRRHSLNSQRARNVVIERVQVLRMRPAAVKVHANNIGELSDAPCIR